MRVVPLLMLVVFAPTFGWLYCRRIAAAEREQEARRLAEARRAFEQRRLELGMSSYWTPERVAEAWRVLAPVVRAAFDEMQRAMAELARIAQSIGTSFEQFAEQIRAAREAERARQR